jgi:hypothetical protein
MASRILNAAAAKPIYTSLSTCRPLTVSIRRGFTILASWCIPVIRPRPSNLRVMGLLQGPTPSEPMTSIRYVSTKQRRRWKIRKYHFKLRLKRTMRKMRVPYMSSKSRGQVKKKPILYDFRPYLRRKLKRAER